VQAQSGTNSSEDVANLQLEAEALLAEITRVSTDTTYNGVKYLGTQAGSVSIQVGYKDGDTISITTNAIDAKSLSLKIDPATSSTDIYVDASGYLDISSATALSTISSAIDTLAGYKAKWGAGQNRLQYTVSNLMNVVEFTTAARSRIQDADFAVEAARLAKAQVLQQTGTAMLAQANASPQLAISLLS